MLRGGGHVHQQESFVTRYLFHGGGGHAWSVMPDSSHGVTATFATYYLFFPRAR